MFHADLIASDLFAARHLQEIRPNVFELTEMGRQLLKPERDIPPIDMGSPLSGHAFDVIEHAYRTLNSLLLQVSRATDFVTQIHYLIACIDNLVEDEPEGALAATMLLPMISYTSGHSVQAAVLLRRLAPQLRLSPADRKVLMGAALTMNIGSAALQNTLNDQEAPLSEAQSNHIRWHPYLSSAVLTAAGLDDELWHRLVREHHENQEGTGYPAKLPGDKQHPLSMALRVADVLGAKLCGRSYRKKLLSRSAWKTMYDPNKTDTPEARLVQLFVKSVGIYPAGTFVRLKNGKVGMVLGQNGTAVETPKVVAFAKGGGFVSLNTADPNMAIVEPVDFSIPDHALSQLGKAWGEH